MTEAKKPKNGEERLRELYANQVLDYLPKEANDQRESSHGTKFCFIILNKLL
ncbi:MAG: hypothetical protein AAFY41_13755 [Bacteroidota bacterium]